MNKEIIEQTKNLIAAHSCCQEAKDAANAWPVSYTHLDVYKRQEKTTSVHWYMLSRLAASGLPTFWSIFGIFTSATSRLNR